MPDNAFNEMDVIHRLVAHDQVALGELYDQYGGLVYSIALRVVQNPTMAEEITQDTFLKVWHQSETWDEARGKFVSWLLTITRYTAIDRLRKEQRRPQQTVTPIDDMQLGRPATVDDPMWQDSRVLRSLLQQLPAEQLQVVELAFFQGMSHSEMASHLDLPLGTVKTRVRLGLQKLKSMWIDVSDEG